MKELSFSRALILSILLHLILCCALMLEFHNTRPTLVADTVTEPGVQIQKVVQAEPIKAVAVDSQELMNTMEKIKAKQQAKVRAEQEHQQKLLAEAKAAELARKQEQMKLEQLKLEAVKLAEQQKKKLAHEKQRLAELKQKQLELKKQQQAEKERQMALARQKAEELKQAQALKAQQEAKLAAEAALRSARIAGEVDKYKALILGAISQQWILPENVGPNLSSQFRIRLAPNGVVLDVNLIRSSGDSILDRSAQAAIYKASPLPVPSDPATFNLFREISLTVRPENVRG